MPYTDFYVLLCAAGWSGSGGLGAKEQGIQDPIKGGDVRDKWDQYKGVGVSLDDPYENYRRNKSYNFVARMKAREEGTYTLHVGIVFHAAQPCVSVYVSISVMLSGPNIRQYFFLDIMFVGAFTFSQQLLFPDDEVSWKTALILIFVLQELM